MSRSPSFSLRSEADLKVDEKSLQQWVVGFCIIRSWAHCTLTLGRKPSILLLLMCHRGCSCTWSAHGASTGNATLKVNLPPAHFSLVAPLLCSIDFRPYFTIHDPDFAHLNSLQEVGNPVMNAARLLSARASTGRIRLDLEGLSLPNLSLNRFTPSNFLNAIKLRRDGPLCLMTEHKEAFWSSYAPITKPDTSILNRLIDADQQHLLKDLPHMLILLLYPHLMPRTSSLAYQQGVLKFLAEDEIQLAGSLQAVSEKGTTSCLGFNGAVLLLNKNSIGCGGKLE
ncbi:hypothetical protein HAX54_037551 [Datura stramonium]|uniref:Uncharacterized protein n=1 Tax=Datura stramonium TaxID=4076 RepID=A0ABS8SHB6_DATST|nr:hypothetical protein [Datura stramonium]